jgi:L,D-peptidoglycan transpeptidase YkuD (ErfK/YbiS/YcfS/YnhG family)
MNWEALKEKYREDTNTNQLLLVKYQGGSRAIVELYDKQDGAWVLIRSGEGEVGREGIGKAAEGDARTPVGEFTLTGAFGIQEDPGAKQTYTHIQDYHYLCADEAYYNQLIDIRQVPHDCSGEHMIEYTQCYAYGMFLDYNKENIFGKGSAIFLHCKGKKGYTAGCVAVDEPFMLEILRRAGEGAKICIAE